MITLNNAQDLTDALARVKSKIKDPLVIKNIWRVMAMREIYKISLTRTEYFKRVETLNKTNQTITIKTTDEFLIGWKQSSYAKCFSHIIKNKLQHIHMSNAGEYVGREYIYNDMFKTKTTMKFGVI